MNLTETILPMPDDYEGKVIATLLRADSTAPSDRAVLYLHGYIDYFFQTHMAERFAGEEWNFYAPVSYTHLDVYKRQTWQPP